MRNNHIQLLFILLTIISCGRKQQNDSSAEVEKGVIETPKLYANIRTAIKIKGVDNIKDTVTIVNSDYFEVELQQLVSGPFEATKELQKPISMEDFRLKFLRITDKDGKGLTFTNSTEFLNFMSEHGYDMADQTKMQYHTDYTFKKKK